MIDRTVFDVEIAILAEMHRHEIASPTIDRYYELLSCRMTTQQFTAACRRLAMSRRAFWPLPGDFLPPVPELLSSSALLAQARREHLPVPEQAQARLHMGAA